MQATNPNPNKANLDQSQVYNCVYDGDNQAFRTVLAQGFSVQVSPIVESCEVEYGKEYLINDCSKVAVYSQGGSYNVWISPLNEGDYWQTLSDILNSIYVLAYPACRIKFERNEALPAEKLVLVVQK